MKSVQIKNVPEDTHAVLRKRAAEEGKSLQEYLRSHLIAEAGRPTLEEVLERVGGRAGGNIGFEAAVESIRCDRNSR